MEKVIHRTRRHAPSQDRQYWLSRSPEERLAALEVLRERRLAHLPDAEQRLQRVCRVAQRGKH
ncbi:hypothetical protein [Ideonella sp. BN130291]|uniref:hypothetical protein n=1 Tax=Ideonella sp. BN130291 TaxID=3112940 RepID=UPI002E268DA0|nr:hypothetical protein [Ideonella sp. BN130291]